ncbi:MAG TPA: hypothetical protein PKL15_18120, partial [Saprospiraceae bacterium]|nr:hypothetical protein [Saprospiraceae bacterium]
MEFHDKSEMTVNNSTCPGYSACCGREGRHCGTTYKDQAKVGREKFLKNNCRGGGKTKMPFTRKCCR